MTVPMSRPGEPPPERRSSSTRSIDAKQLWSGGVATALVAALIALAGILVCRWLFDIPILAPRGDGAWGNASPAGYSLAAAAAASEYPAVDALPHAPSPRGARMGMSNSHRHTRMPASAISAATSAVATPPDHSCFASMLRVEELLRPGGCGSPGLDIGTVIGLPYVDPADLA